MAQVGTSVVAAGVTVAGGVDRREIVLVEAVADVHDPGRREQVTVAGVTRRHDAVEQVDAAHHGRHDVLGPADAHEITRPPGRHVRYQRLEDSQALLLGLPDRESADRQPRPVEAQQRLERGEAQRCVHAALHDPEQSPGRIRRVGTVVVSVAARRPAHGALHRLARLGLGGRMLGAVIQRHGDVRAQRELHLHGVFRGEPHFAAVERRTKAYPLLGDATQALQAEHLEAAGIGEERLLPMHETVQPAMRGDDGRPGTQHEVEGVGENDLGAQSCELLGRHRLDRAIGADRHECRGLDHAVSGHEPAGARGAIARLHGEGRPQARSRMTSMASP